MSENLNTEEQEIETEEEVVEEEVSNQSPGFLSLDQWKEQGKDPDDWVAPGAYKKIGELIDSNKSLQRRDRRRDEEHNEMITNMNKFQLQQRQMAEDKITTLQSELADAIELADPATATRIQGQIDNTKDSMRGMNTPIEQRQAETAPVQEVVDWNAANPWILEKTADGVLTPKAQYAQAVYGQAVQSNMNKGMDREASMVNAINAVDRAVASEFPNTNPNRSKGATTSKGRNSRQSNAVTVTMADLTTDENEQWRQFGKNYKDESEFLKTVQACRG